MGKKDNTKGSMLTSSSESENEALLKAARAAVAANSAALAAVEASYSSKYVLATAKAYDNERSSHSLRSSADGSSVDSGESSASSDSSSLDSSDESECTSSDLIEELPSFDKEKSGKPKLFRPKPIRSTLSSRSLPTAFTKPIWKKASSTRSLPATLSNTNLPKKNDIRRFLSSLKNKKRPAKKIDENTILASAVKIQAVTRGFFQRLNYREHLLTIKLNQINSDKEAKLKDIEQSKYDTMDEFSDVTENGDARALKLNLRETACLRRENMRLRLEIKKLEGDREEVQKNHAKLETQSFMERQLISDTRERVRLLDQKYRQLKLDERHILEELVMMIIINKISTNVSKYLRIRSRQWSQSNRMLAIESTWNIKPVHI